MQTLIAMAMAAVAAAAAAAGRSPRPPAAAPPPFRGAAPPKRYMVLGTWGHGAGAATPDFVDAAAAAGFNAVRVTANWGYMEQAPGVIDWALLDNQTAYIHDVAKLPLCFNIWCQRYHPDAVVPRSGFGEDQTGAGGVSNATWSVSFANETALASAMRFVTSVVERYGKRYPDTLSFSVVFDGYSETEYFPGGAMLEPGVSQNLFLHPVLRCVCCCVAHVSSSGYADLEFRPERTRCKSCRLL